MSRTRQPRDIQVKQSPLHGQGVFACKDFGPGDTIEISPVVLLPRAEKELLQSTSLFRFYFLVGDEATPVALGLGYSSLYNHAYPANATYCISLKKAAISIKACRPIRKNEEITLNYNGAPDDPAPTWFPPETAATSESLSVALAAKQPLSRGCNDLYIKKILHKGRGVFSRRPIEREEVIEICPVLVLPPEDYEMLNATGLSDYFFNFSKEEKLMALSLGFGSIYNHAKDSNAGYFLDRDNRTFTYYALERIPPGVEICINYSGEPGQDFPEWFESRNIRPVSRPGRTGFLTKLIHSGSAL
jgi:SET domain-containing protein